MFQLCLSLYVLITLCILVLSFEFDFVWSTRYSPVFLWVCPALSCLDVFIKEYYLSLCPRLHVPVPPSCVHRDRRPDLTVSGAPSPRFVFVFESFVLVPVYVCPAAWKSPLVIPAIAHCKSAWEFGGIAASPLAANPHARRSREISARLWLKPAWSPLTQACRIGADSCPPAAAIPSPVDQVHMSRPGVPCVCLVVPTGTF